MEWAADPARFQLLIALAGEAKLGEEQTKAGDVWVVPASAGPVRIENGEGFRMLRAYVPEK
jgi:uncharacterized protein YjlB